MDRLKAPAALSLLSHFEKAYNEAAHFSALQVDVYNRFSVISCSYYCEAKFLSRSDSCPHCVLSTWRGVPCSRRRKDLQNVMMDETIPMDFRLDNLLERGGQH